MTPSMAGRAAAASAAFATVAFIAAQTARPGLLADADHAAFAAVRARRCQPGIVAARAISMAAEPGLTYPAVVLTGIMTSGRTGWRQAAVPVLVLATGVAARRRVSRIIARPRPPSEAWLTEPEGYSLPSKHTTAATLTAGACARAVSARGHGYAAATLAAVLVGGSRVYLGVHWPGDVVAGWLFAIGWLGLTEPFHIPDRAPI
jgi:undecaprenyl-diphosphatase